MCHLACKLIVCMCESRISILDNILGMMEKYANNLEEIVDERTQQLVEEKKKTDRLLYKMLPSYVQYTRTRCNTIQYKHRTVNLSKIYRPYIYTLMCYIIMLQIICDITKQNKTRYTEQTRIEKVTSLVCISS